MKPSTAVILVSVAMTGLWAQAYPGADPRRATAEERAAARAKAQASRTQWQALSTDEKSANKVEHRKAAATKVEAARGRAQSRPFGTPTR